MTPGTKALDAAVALALAAGFLLPGCAGPAQEEPAPDVVVTFYPLEFVVRRIVGDDLRVATFVPPGVHPSEYEPGPREALRVAQARMVVYLGGGLEPWLPVLERVGGSATFVNATRGVTFVEDEGFPEDLPEEGEAPREEDRGAHKEDPHVWLDPVRMRTVVDNVLEAVLALDGSKEATYRARAEALKANLDALHERYDRGLAQCESRHLVVTHAAYGYLVVRYHLYQHGFTSAHLKSEAVGQRIVKVVEFARKVNATAVFEDPAADPRLARLVAAELGGRVLPLDPIEGLRPEARAEGRNYLSLMDDNLASLREGLGCR